MAQDEEKLIKELQKNLGGPMQILGQLIIQLSMSGNPCDVTFRGKKPAVNVTIDQKIGLALMYGAGAKKLLELLNSIRLSNGDTVSVNEIWTIFPMPKGGISEKELAEVDLSQGDVKAGPNGETVREMIRNVFHCESKQEEDKFLRRYIAS